MRNSYSLAIYLMVFYNVIDAHVVDIHFITPEEERMMDQARHQRNTEKDLDILTNEKSSPEEKNDALVRLVDSGAMS